ncbi:MAG: M20 family peptidase [Anaerolineaceae bacterium]|nr:M20 family peptidase [Anaerolineaceae bacterium]
MILNVLIVLLVLILFLAAFVVLRTLSFPRPYEAVEPEEGLKVDPKRTAKHLAAAIRCQTVSVMEGAPPDHEAMQQLHAVIQKQYPLAHKHLQRSVINDYSLVYTWVGRQPDLPPVLFAAHQDVVPADPEGWSHPPFAGEIADGFVWGRGALDLKNQLVALLESVEALLQAGFQPQRTIYLAFGHDEEIGGHNGAKQIVEWLEKNRVELAAVLDEGGFVSTDMLPGVSLPVALVGTSEKGYLTLKLTVDVTGGHSSIPPAQTAIGILSRALARIESHPLPAHPGLMRPMFEHVGIAAPFVHQMAFANLWLSAPLLNKMLSGGPQTNAGIRTTTAVTVIRGGVKDNILPAHAEALVNFRLAPGDTIAFVCDHVRKAIKDERVHFEAVEGGAWQASPISPTDVPFYADLAAATRKVFGNIPVAPFLFLGGSDARHYTSLCPNVYRFSPLIVSSETLARIHGVDERVAVDAMVDMVRFYSLLIRDWCGGED